jgi:hypothetical protein
MLCGLSLIGPSSATFIIRSSVPNNHYSLSGDHTASLTVLHILNRVIGNEAESPQTRKKACFTLCTSHGSSHVRNLPLRELIDYFVTDDKDLCMFAYERGSLTKLSQVVNSITPSDRPPTWEEEESEHISSLREVNSCVQDNHLPLTHSGHDRRLSARSQPCRCGIMIFVGRSPKTIP